MWLVEENMFVILKPSVFIYKFIDLKENVGSYYCHPYNVVDGITDTPIIATQPNAVYLILTLSMSFRMHEHSLAWQ